MSYQDLRARGIHHSYELTTEQDLRDEAHEVIKVTLSNLWCMPDFRDKQH